jgi:hypothetical protein
LTTGNIDNFGTQKINYRVKLENIDGNALASIDGSKFDVIKGPPSTARTGDPNAGTVPVTAGASGTNGAAGSYGATGGTNGAAGGTNGAAGGTNGAAGGNNGAAGASGDAWVYGTAGGDGTPGTAGTTGNKTPQSPGFETDRLTASSKRYTPGAKTGVGAGGGIAVSEPQAWTLVTPQVECIAY